MFKSKRIVLMFVLGFILFNVSTSFAEPPQPIITRPNTSEVILDERVRFSWADVGDEFEYELYEEDSKKVVINKTRTQKSNITIDAKKLKFDKTYVFKITSVDGNERSIPDTIIFTTIKPLLIAPDIRSPRQDGQITLDESIRIRWEDLGYRYGYTLYDRDTSTYVIKSTKTFQTYVDISKLKLSEGHSYLFSLWSERDRELSEVNELYFMTLPRAPRQPEINSPKNKTVFKVGEPVRISWKSTEKEYTYSLYKEETNELVDSGTIKRSVFNIDKPLLEHGTSYKFEVSSIYKNQVSKPVQVRFKTEYEGAEPPEIKTPKSGSKYNLDDEIKVSWTQTERKYKYRVLNTLTGLEVIGWTITPFNERTIDSEKLLQGETYTIEVCSMDGKEVSSPVLSEVTIKEVDVKTPNIRSPKNNTVFSNGSPVQIEWKDIGQQYEYSIYDWTNETLMSGKKMTTLSSVRLDSSRLKGGHWYKFKLVGYDNGFSSKPTEVAFYVEGNVEDIKLKFPVNNGVYIAHENETYKWSHVATAYRCTLYDENENRNIIENKKVYSPEYDFTKYFKAGHSYTLEVRPEVDEKTFYKPAKANFMVTAIDEDLDSSWMEKKLKKIFYKSDLDEKIDLSDDYLEMAHAYFLHLGLIEETHKENDRLSRRDIAKLFNSYQNFLMKKEEDHLTYSDPLYTPYLNSVTSVSGDKKYFLENPMKRSEFFCFIGGLYGLKGLNTKDDYREHEYPTHAFTNTQNMYIGGALDILNEPVPALDQEIQLNEVALILMKLEILNDRGNIVGAQCLK